MTTVPTPILDMPIVGRNLRGATLRAHLGGAATLLVFLRHLA